MRTLLAAALVCALAAPAWADDGLVAAPTVITVPTAWIQPGGAAHVSGDVDHRLGSGVRVTAGLGRLAELSIASSDELVHCDPCRGEARATEGLQLATGGFKLALWRDALFTHQPAVAVGVNAPFSSRDGERAAEAFAIASLIAGPVRFHVGASAWRTSHLGADGAEVRTGGLRTPRPLAGLEWTPTIYPRTTLSTDVQWVPELGPTRAETDPRWLFAWGVRYRAFSWGAIELAVKHRQTEQLGDATVMLRLSARIGKGMHL